MYILYIILDSLSKYISKSVETETVLDVENCGIIRHQDSI